MKKTRPLFIAITGDVASGKSTALEFFRSMSFPCLSVDCITNGLHNNPEIQREISDLFQMEKYDKDTVKKLAFGSPEKRLLLENLLHPRIFFELQRQMDTYLDSPTPPLMVFVEVPLLFECKLENCFDTNILITSNRKIKLNRMKNRGKGGRNIAIQILDAQMRQSDKKKRADHEISNNGERDALYLHLFLRLEYLKSTRKRKLRRLYEI